MGRRFLAMSGVWVLMCVALAAADFWTDKDFMSWSDTEVEKMLTDSPWSREVTIVLSVIERPGTGRIGGNERGIVWDPNIAEAVERAGRGAGLPSGEANGVRRATVTVSWVRALPVKLAVVRSQIGINAAIPPEGQELLWKSEPYYVVSVSQLPQSFGALSQDISPLLAQTELKRKDKEPIVPVSVRFFPNDQDQSLQVMYWFSKIDAITLDDKDVEFVTRLGGVDIKRKFTLSDMVFGDRLEL